MGTLQQSTGALEAATKKASLPPRRVRAVLALHIAILQRWPPEQACCCFI